MNLVFAFLSVDRFSAICIIMNFPMRSHRIPKSFAYADFM